MPQVWGSGSLLSQPQCGPLRSWRCGLDQTCLLQPTLPGLPPTSPIPHLTVRGVPCSLASPELGSLLGLAGLGQAWMGHALIHGQENPSLVICQLSLRPGPVARPPTPPCNPGLGAPEGSCSLIVCETPRIILNPPWGSHVPALARPGAREALACSSSQNPLRASGSCSPSHFEEAGAQTG